MLARTVMQKMGEVERVERVGGAWERERISDPRSLTVTSYPFTMDCISEYCLYLYTNCFLCSCITGVFTKIDPHW
jgi:hypothetical protein